MGKTPLFDTFVKPLPEDNQKKIPKNNEKALMKILKKILSVIVLMTKLWSISYRALNLDEGKIQFTMENLKEIIEQSISVRSGIQHCAV